MKSKRVPFYLAVGLEEDVLPDAELTVTYQGKSLRLLPGTKDAAPAVVIECDAPECIAGRKPTFSLDDARRTVKQFLSALAWARGTAIRETFGSAATATVVPWLLLHGKGEFAK